MVIITTSSLTIFVQVQHDHHPHCCHLVVSLHWSCLSQAQNGFTWDWWDLWGLWNITQRDESSVWKYNPGNCVDEDKGERGLPPKLLESPINTLLRLSAPGGADLLLIDQHVHHHYHYHHYHPYSLCHQYHHIWCQDPYRVFKIIITIMNFSAQPWRWSCHNCLGLVWSQCKRKRKKERKIMKEPYIRC